MLFGDLLEVKTVLRIDPCDTSRDTILTFYLEWCSALIEEILNRPNMSKKRVTEFYNGTGTQRLLLRRRPVYVDDATTIDVYVDTDGGHFGATSGAFQAGNLLTYGSDYCLQIDQDDGTSRSGILIRINSLWQKPFARQGGYLSPFLTNDAGSIKVVYTAGYTVDNCPAVLRAACNILIAQFNYLFPLGILLTSESYEERSISILHHKKWWLTSLISPMLLAHRNWYWG